MTGMILDGVLMLLLVAALGYGVIEPVRVAAPALTPVAPPADDERAQRMAALAERIQGMAIPAKPRAAGESNVAAILGAIAANQSAKQSLNRARRSLDEDLFAA